jgi:hypothetical protein
VWVNVIPTDTLLGGPGIPVTLNVMFKGDPPEVGHVPDGPSGIGPTPLPGKVVWENETTLETAINKRNNESFPKILLDI